MPDGTCFSLQQQRNAYKPILAPPFHHLEKIKCSSIPFSPKIEKDEADKLFSSFPWLAAAQKSTFNKMSFFSDDTGLSKYASDSFIALRIGVVLSGGQAPGGHNVIIGLFDALQQMHPNSQLYGFLDGPGGIVDGEYCLLNEEQLFPYRNSGGFDLLFSGRVKIESEEQFAKAAAIVRKLSLDGLVIIGGDDSNTNAAFLAEYFLSQNIPCSVIGVPKTIDGDLKNDDIEIPFGFDTASKVYSEIIGNLQRDALSAKKYYFFVKLMGRSASHLTMECAFKTHPNMVLIAEEIAAKQMPLSQVVDSICSLIVSRAAIGKNYGVILIPEGLIEFIPEFSSLIKELNALLAATSPSSQEIERLTSLDDTFAYLQQKLSTNSKNVFSYLSNSIKEQLLLARDPHGNVQVSKIETERLLIDLTTKRLQEYVKGNPSLKTSLKFNPQPLFFGYEGRCSFPSNFDANYTYNLGFCAAMLIANGVTGYIAAIQNLTKHPSKWLPMGIPLLSMFEQQERHGKLKYVIKKALVDVDSFLFHRFTDQRQHWELSDDYLYPGPIQFYGDPAITDAVPLSLQR